MDLAPVQEHLALLVMVTVGAVWVINKALALSKSAKSFVSHVVDERVPDSIKKSLNNGIQELVDRKNAEQETRMVKYIQECFKEHEHREEQNIERLLNAISRPRR